MFSTRLNELVEELIVNVCQNDDVDIVQKYKSYAYFLCQSEYRVNKFKNYSFWQKKWKSQIVPELIPLLNDLSYRLPKSSHPIYTFLDIISTARFKMVNSVEQRERKPRLIKYSQKLTDAVAVKEILNILRDNSSEILVTNDNGSLDCKNLLTVQQRSVFRYVFRIKKCLDTINSMITSLSGNLKGSIKNVLMDNYDMLLHEIQSIPENITLINLTSLISGYIFEKSINIAKICYVIKSNIFESSINALTYCLGHGDPCSYNICSVLIDTAMKELLIYIRNWVVFGHLSDDMDEFFIVKKRGRVESDLWWSTKYTLDEKNIPLFMNDKVLIKKILVSGRSINFVDKHKDQCIRYIDNFGTSAPFAVNFSSKDKTKTKNIKWEESEPFTLLHVTHYYKIAIASMKNMMFDILWIQGHLATVIDFILFARGDFCNALYNRFESTVDGDPPYLLNEAMFATTKGNSYTNRVTSERYNDRVCLKYQYSLQPETDKLELQYRVNPPIDIFFTKSVLEKYYMIGTFIWKIKVAEYKLCNNWKISKRLKLLTNVGLDKIGFLVMAQLRHSMLLVITAFVEYFSTDVIRAKSKKTIQRLTTSDDFDDMIHIHNDFLETILGDTFQTDIDIEILEGIHTLLDKYKSFIEYSDELDKIYYSIVNFVDDNPDWKRNGIKFFERQGEILTKLRDRMIILSNELDDTVCKMYFDYIKNSTKFSMLEVRLRTTVLGIMKKKHEVLLLMQK